MRLKEYFEKNCINVKAFQRKCGISMNTIYKAMSGKEVYLSVALRIEEATEGKVRCIDMKPLDQYKRNAGGSKKKINDDVQPLERSSVPQSFIELLSGENIF